MNGGQAFYCLLFILFVVTLVQKRFFENTSLFGTMTGFLYEAGLEEGLGKKKRKNGLRLGRFLPIR